MGLKLAQNEVFLFLSKIDARNFPAFCVKLQYHKDFIEKLSFEVIRHKIKFFKLCEKSIHRTFLIFGLELHLQQHEGF